MNLNEVRSYFPALSQKIHGHDLIYFDSAATTLKPQQVIDRVTRFYSLESANVHRGAHYLSDQATGHFENTRSKVADFVGCDIDEVIFTRGTTESINLVAASFGEVVVGAGDEVLISELEHHGNLVPWQVLCGKVGARLQVCGINDQGEIDFVDFQKKLNRRTKIVAVSGCSNTLGTITDLNSIVSAAHSVGVVDAAQLVSQASIDFKNLGVDFLAFSGHKLFGPTGIGVLVVKKKHFEKMKPYQTGGSMIKQVTFAETTFQDGPLKFEAGTPHIEGVIGLGSAIDFFREFQILDIQKHEKTLRLELEQFLRKNPLVQILGESEHKGAITSFVVKGIHHSDLAAILDQQGIAVRAGHLCTQPLLTRFNVSGFLRVSISIYNNLGDVQKFQTAFNKAIQMLG
jgi:cysteine desulfurase/selenocysteine lyase